jgi:hypothetical protein
MKHVTSASYQDGVFKIRNESELINFCKMLNCSEFNVSIEKKKSKRSDNQNRFYWVAIVPTMLAGFKELGNEMDLESTHEFIKANFNYKEVVNEQTGDVLKVPKSTATLNKTEFSEMIEKANLFCIEWFGFSLPESGSQQQMNF